jgi:hypothetical protein
VKSGAPSFAVPQSVIHDSEGIAAACGWKFTRTSIGVGVTRGVSVGVGVMVGVAVGVGVIVAVRVIVGVGVTVGVAVGVHVGPV